MKKYLILIFILLFAISRFVQAENPQEATGDNFSRATATVMQQLEESLAELSKLREQIVKDKIPLSRKLSDLEGGLIKVRHDYQQTSRLLDSRALDLSNLRNEIKMRQEEATYLSNLLSEYNRNFEARLHIAEIQRYREPLTTAKLAPENSILSKHEVYQAQTALVGVSLEHLNDALGGACFQGNAVVANGLLKHGTFVLVGPAALFRSEDGKDIGIVERLMGSLEPAVIGFETADDATAAEKVITDLCGYFPIDPTLGKALKIEAIKETLWEHIKKGGPVMVPILLLAGAALFVALYKWISMRSLSKAPREQINALLLAVARHDQNASMQIANAISGPVGNMLAVGVKHLQGSRELIEEVMYETVLSTRLKIQSLLPFVAMSATCAPLLGLLGTVTGIIRTFNLITIFGSGDAKTLSSGISEALITTEYGLMVAIPSLLMHAFLSRKARGVIDQMEKATVAFINQLCKTPYEHINEEAVSNTAMNDKR
jgi:biopolymer transport protein ExbB